MHCPRCHAGNRDGLKFCEDCGTRLAVACASVGPRSHRGKGSAAPVGARLPLRTLGCAYVLSGRVPEALPLGGGRLRHDRRRDRCTVAPGEAAGRGVSASPLASRTPKPPGFRRCTSRAHTRRVGTRPGRSNSWARSPRRPTLQRPRTPTATTATPLAATGRTPRGVRPTSPYWTPAHRIQPGSPNGTGSAGGRASWDRSMART
jgi:hypothetical protein